MWRYSVCIFSIIEKNLMPTLVTFHVNKLTRVRQVDNVAFRSVESRPRPAAIDRQLSVHISRTTNYGQPTAL